MREFGGLVFLEEKNEIVACVGQKVNPSLVLNRVLYHRFRSSLFQLCTKPPM